MNIQIIWDLLSTLRQMRKRDEWSHQQVVAHQANALRRLREYTYVHSPFYQRFHRGLAEASLQELPVSLKGASAKCARLESGKRPTAYFLEFLTRGVSLKPPSKKER